MCYHYPGKSTNKASVSKYRYGIPPTLPDLDLNVLFIPHYYITTYSHKWNIAGPFLNSKDISRPFDLYGTLLMLFKSTHLHPFPMREYADNWKSSHNQYQLNTIIAYSPFSYHFVSQPLTQGLVIYNWMLFPRLQSLRFVQIDKKKAMSFPLCLLSKQTLVSVLLSRWLWGKGYSSISLTADLPMKCQALSIFSLWRWQRCCPSQSWFLSHIYLCHLLTSPSSPFTQDPVPFLSVDESIPNSGFWLSGRHV